MKILYYASILTGGLDSPELTHDNDAEVTSSDKPLPKSSTIGLQVI